MELNSSLNKRTRRILLVIYGCDIFKIDSGGALRNTLFAKALSEIGHVDVICFSRDGVVSDIPNCDVIYSKKMYEHYNLLDSIRTLLGTLFCPSSPSSYYKVSKKKSAIVSDFVKRGKYDIIGPIAHFAGCDHVQIPILTRVSRVSNVSEHKSMVEIAQ